MEYLADSHTMKAVDNCSIQEFKIPSVVLMERAALGVSVFLKGLISKKCSNKCVKVVCVCGSGNNGADGLAVARQLNEEGINVRIVLAGTSDGTEEYKECRDEVTKSAFQKGSRFLRPYCRYA